MTSIDNIQNRAALKELFKSGALPSEQDFASLINSVLVKRDDHFFGTWQKGAGYREGDTVLYSEIPGQMGIYVLVSEKQAKAIADAQGKDADCLDDECCGNKPPGECGRWQLIHVDSDDHDWHVVQDGTRTVMYAEVVGKLGVGTTAPDAFLHLNAATEGAGSQLLFNPAGSNGGPTLRLKSGVQSAEQGAVPALYVDQAVRLADSSVEWLTNVPLGYAFKKQVAADSGNPDDVLLLLVGSTPSNTPHIGIGTATPQATLDMVGPASGIQLDTDNPNGPQLTLLKMGAKGKPVQVVQTVDGQQVSWSTNALHGFLFSVADKSLVLIDGNGNVGIGTTTPANKLDIVAANGRFSFDVDSVNPMLSVTNLKDDGGEVNLNLSVDFNTTVLETDADQGFEFRQNARRIMSISRDANAKRPTFSAIVDGLAYADGLYVRSLQGDLSPLESGLAFLKTLEPQVRLAEGDNHTQMGFVFSGRTGRSSKIARQFPDKTFGIAQHNLIALLVRSVQELNDRIDALQDEIAGLKQGK